MPYPILSPNSPDDSRKSLCAMAVMAKAPRPGKVKTRLCPPLTPEQSAALNICFLKDTTENLAQIASHGSAAGLISYTPEGEEALFDGLLPQSFALVLQRGDGFGERLLAAAEDILACGFGAVCRIDSDSPTVPASAFQQAVDALKQPGDRIVLGPSSDGGYYLIGMKQAHPEPFQNIHWSTSTVFEETLAAAKAAGMEVVQLPLWYDVDDGATLEILTEELIENHSPIFVAKATHAERPGHSPQPGYAAVHTKKFLAERLAFGPQS